MPGASNSKKLGRSSARLPQALGKSGRRPRELGLQHAPHTALVRRRAPCQRVEIVPSSGIEAFAALIPHARKQRINARVTHWQVFWQEQTWEPAPSRRAG